MSENCFLTSEKDKGFIERVGEDYLLIKDIYTDEQARIEVDKEVAKHFENECSDGEVVYLCYNKATKELV